MRPCGGQVVSSRSAKHRKSKRAADRRPGPARHRKPSPIASALQNHPTKTAAAVTGAVLIAAAAPAASHWVGDVGTGQAAVLSQSGRERLGGHAGAGSRTHQPRHASTSAHPSTSASRSAGTKPPRHARRQATHHHPAPAVYNNPLRAIKGLIPERIDQGVDFGGSGPIYAIGDAVITNATTSAGWPGGGWITYTLAEGPAKGLTVFVAEDVTPTVSAGQHVTSGTVIAHMYDGGDGIEMGWATSDGSTARSQLADA